LKAVCEHVGVLVFPSPRRIRGDPLPSDGNLGEGEDRQSLLADCD